MKILITGASGMLGKALLKALIDQPSLHVFTPTRQDLDYTHKEAVLNYFQQERFDFVYHLAAQVGGIAANIADPVGFFYNNMQINLNVIRAAHMTGVKQFINVGSSCMYPRNREILKEKDLLTGELEPTNEGYAISKISGMLYCKYLSQQFNLHYKTIIPCNLYGEHDHFDLEKAHLVPAIIRKIHDAKTRQDTAVTIWGDGEARREFMHVVDLVSGLMKALKDYDTMPMLMNMGLGHDYSINEYYTIAAKVMDYRGHFLHDLSKPAGMKQKLIDIARAQSWGWAPQMSIEEGIRRVYDYVQHHHIFD